MRNPSGLCSCAAVGTDAAWNSEAAPTENGDGCTLYDHTAPTITSLNVPARATPGFAVSWSAQDNLNGVGVSHYDVQYANESGVWTDWVSTPWTQAVFTGPGGHTYTFRVSATDGVGNESGWQSSGQVTVPLVKKYYAAAGRRVAMRAEGVVYYLHSDHLGSTSLVTGRVGNVVAQQLYLPYGAPRWGSGTLPTDFTFTGQRADSYIKLTQMGARWYDADLGRWISPDFIVPDFANLQSLNRYSYVNHRPLNYIDPSGHCPWCIPLIALMVFMAMLPGDTGPYPPSPGNEIVGDIALRMANEPYDLARTGQDCLSGQCGWLDALSLLPLIPGGLSKLDDLADAAKASSKLDDVRHATDYAQSVLKGIDFRKITKPGRFGKAFYVAEEGGTAIAEVAAHGGDAKQVIRFQLDLSKAKVLDLTNPDVAKAWGYVEDVNSYAAHQALAQKAMEQGYNAVKFGGYRGPGFDYALLDNPLNPFNFDEWLIPRMVSPAP